MNELVFFVPPAAEHAGGGSAYDRHLIASLRDLGARVDVIVVEDALDARQGSSRLPGTAIGVVDGMVLPFFDAGPDQDPWPDGRAAAIIHHPTALADPARRATIREAELRLLPRLGRVVATSEAVGARLLAEFGVTARQLRVVTPGMAVLPRSHGSAGGTCQVLSVGRLARRKGHDTLMRALARLSDLDWRLTIAGDTHGDAAWTGELLALADELGIAGRVAVVERPEATVLESLWQTADLFALASRRETTGIAIAEALRRGVPVAVTACEAMVPQEAGVVCAPDDVATLSKSLRRMIFDEAVRLRMAEAAWIGGRGFPGWPEQAALFLNALGGSDSDGPGSCVGPD